jgi:hypothetical protein
VVLLLLAAVPPAWLDRLPSLCINQSLLGFCPACGTVRALAHLLHGEFPAAVAHNPNCLLVGPLLLALLLLQARGRLDRRLSRV